MERYRDKLDHGYEPKSIETSKLRLDKGREKGCGFGYRCGYVQAFRFVK